MVSIVPVVSIVVPFWGLSFRILNIELVKPKKGTTMETIGTVIPKNSVKLLRRPLYYLRSSPDRSPCRGLAFSRAVPENLNCEIPLFTLNSSGPRPPAHPPPKKKKEKEKQNICVYIYIYKLIPKPRTPGHVTFGCPLFPKPRR